MDGGCYYASDEFRRVRRLALWGCGLGLVAAYLTALPLKSWGWMPESVGWLELVCMPLAMFGLLAWAFVAPSVWPRKPVVVKTAGVFIWAALWAVVYLVARG